jgi:hypothetical protein
VIEGLRPQSQTVPFVGFAESQILGSQPNLALGHEDSAKPPFRPDAPCENQQPPNLQVTNGPAPKQVAPKSFAIASSSSRSSQKSSTQQSILQASADYAKSYRQAQQLTKDGKATRATTLMGDAMKQWLRARAKADPQLGAQLESKGQGSSK